MWQFMSDNDDDSNNDQTSSDDDEDQPTSSSIPALNDDVNSLVTLDGAPIMGIRIASMIDGDDNSGKRLIASHHFTAGDYIFRDVPVMSQPFPSSLQMIPTFIMNELLQRLLLMKPTSPLTHLCATRYKQLESPFPHSWNDQQWSMAHAQLITNTFIMNLPSPTATSTTTVGMSNEVQQVMALFPNVSRMNHACAPNAVSYRSSDGSSIVYAMTTIIPGDEITIGYRADILQLPRHLRQQILFNNWGFHCTCCRCNPSIPSIVSTSLQTTIESFVDALLLHSDSADHGSDTIDDNKTVATKRSSLSPIPFTQLDEWLVMGDQHLSLLERSMYNDQCEYVYQWSQRNVISGEASPVLHASLHQLKIARDAIVTWWQWVLDLECATYLHPYHWRRQQMRTLMMDHYQPMMDIIRRCDDTISDMINTSINNQLWWSRRYQWLADIIQCNAMVWPELYHVKLRAYRTFIRLIMEQQSPSGPSTTTSSIADAILAKWDPAFSRVLRMY
jgi:hypothetical protein